MIDKSIVNQVVTEFLQENPDIYLVDLQILPDNKIVVEIDTYEGVSIQMCENLNRFIEKKLDRNTEDYNLEVSSAGLTSPFKVLNQYIKNIGKAVEVQTADGQKLAGILKQAGENDFTIIVEKKMKPEGAKRKIVVFEEITFNYKNIKKTEYLLKV
ncbi:MAG: ribosome assembly cofactor RimP [Prevotellaceae bacterium]|jgi:ribosome maturation factor RimP|nr:ribosome assembly cofactor RimP [Prevotellaceae bacterium]